MTNKAGVVMLYDENRIPKKIDIRTISHYGDGYFICRVDYGVNAVPRFAEVKFHESEIEFTDKVEGK